MPAVLVTRPEADAEETAAELKKRGYDVICDSILSINPQIWAEPDWQKIDGIIITSKNALAGFAGHMIPKHTMFSIVGERTSQALRKAGFVHVTGTVERSDDLPPLIRLQHKPGDGALLHLTARHTHNQFYASLQADGYVITPVVVYEAAAAAAFQPETIAALRSGAIQAVTFYSARSAEIFHDLARKSGMTGKLKSVQAVCLSRAIADSCDATLWQKLFVAERPTQQHMLECLANHVR